ncbi:MAG: Clp protease ClpP [Firmicutes bacterium]|nr:Clp protease ClpP [Bacillota bacterium]
MRKFWNWAEPASKVRDSDTDERTLYLNGPIAEETWWGDEQTPAAFKKELLAGSGPVTVWINSPGGDVFAAAQIYNMLMEYTGAVTVKIDGIAASAASVIAMAGGKVHMSPVSMLMIHNPATIASGDSEEMLKAKALLDEIKESIINSYALKTGLSRAKLSHLMDNETWMNAHKAVELGFADKILYADGEEPEDGTEPKFAWNKGGVLFSCAAVTNSLLGKMPKPKAKEPDPPAPAEPAGIRADSLYHRLNLITH